MKPRKVMIHMEVLTDMPLIFLRDKNDWLNIMWDRGDTSIFVIHQITVQVIKEDK